MGQACTGQQYEFEATVGTRNATIIARCKRLPVNTETALTDGVPDSFSPADPPARFYRNLTYGTASVRRLELEIIVILSIHRVTARGL